MEVEQQPERHVQQFHLAQQLCLVDWQDILGGFDLNKKRGVDEQIKPERFREDVALVVYDDLLLVDGGNPRSSSSRIRHRS
jgi:hypothetical protein